ncbi:hypothetical protein HII12_002002 [Brettanomyces bruxellensis]|uniref:DEBR0S1_00452g1_1 n=1 Tax=Dekkera bruxellensis TaxID=5007 RepID=A0A3F2XWT5_DEKBR|nr:hypothetical protein HII12_002002 [Brettanomyces bruxellensis]VUG15802.1 DEBR0S1_00452g1_1 [Brettanomyces bruxellensis]
MSNQVAEIEEPKIPGNYSARTNHRWIPAAEVNQSSQSAESSNVISTKSRQEDVDEIHQTLSKFHVSPGQMYSTESGQMFHAGSICIILVGLPARGKTNLAIGLCRYLRWLGVRTNLFHFEDYRRDYIGTQNDGLLSEGQLEEQRQCLRKIVVREMTDFFKNDRGQVAIFDSVNGNSDERVDLALKMKRHDIRTVFIESLVDDHELLKSNIREATKSPDYEGWEEKLAILDYTKKVGKMSKSFESLTRKDFTWIQSRNLGRTVLVNKLQHDFLTTKIIFYIMNVRLKSGSVYFARCSNNKLQFKSDPPLTKTGTEYISKMYNALLRHFNSTRSGKGFPPDLEIWTSTRLRTMQAAAVFKEAGLVVKPRSELNQLNPGDSEGLTDQTLKGKYPSDYEHHKLDPYHHRYPRAESYHDLALKLEPLILEVGRIDNDILIIADETVIRVFYGYLMASSSSDIPFMRFPSNEIIEITYNAYVNKAKRIKIPGVSAD